MRGALRLGSGMAEPSCAHSCLLRAFSHLLMCFAISPIDKASNGPTPSRNVPGESRGKRRHASSVSSKSVNKERRGESWQQQQRQQRQASGECSQSVSRLEISPAARFDSVCVLAVRV